MMKKLMDYLPKILIPLLLGGAILWWMYRGFDWSQISAALDGGMNWTWMLLSLPFGISAQVFRALRWRQALEPMGEHPRINTCINAIFLSYGSSLVIPRVGEFLRCGILSRYDGISFGKGVGTVVTERVVDILMILLLSLITILCQIPVFTQVVRETGLSLDTLTGKFTAEGYLVTGICLFFIIATSLYMMRKFQFMNRLRTILKDLRDGIFSIRYVRRIWLFVLYSIGIWVSYFLHFYLTFYCFEYTAHLGISVALVAFVVGTFAVLVPTPNGAGPWHFAVKTVLVLYGVSNVDGAIYVLIVHTIQTALVLFLGLYSLAILGFTRRKNISTYL